MKFKDVFQRLGLGKNAAMLYEALLTSKRPMHVTELAQAISTSRTEVYRNLEACLEQGFVEKVSVGKRTYYSAKDPRFVLERFNTIGGQAQELTRAAAKKIEREFPAHIQYFKGPTGIRAVFDDVISRMPKKGTFYRYTSERDLAKVNSYLSPTYRADRDAKKLERLVISNPTSGKAKRSRLERFIKYFPPEADRFDQNIIQLVYADSLAFINLSREEAYIIRDPDLARFQSVIFKQLYKKL